MCFTKKIQVKNITSPSNTKVYYRDGGRETSLRDTDAKRKKENFEKDRVDSSLSYLPIINFRVGGRWRALKGYIFRPIDVYVLSALLESNIRVQTKT